MLIGHAGLVACGPDDEVQNQDLEDGGLDAAGPCEGTLEEVDEVFAFQGTCPATWSEALERGPLCEGFGAIVRIGELYGMYAYQMDWRTHRKDCFYDKETEELVGAVACDDVPSFCSHSSRTIQFGEAPGTCTSMEEPDEVLDCP